MPKLKPVSAESSAQNPYYQAAFWMLTALIAGGTLLLNTRGYDLYGLPKIAFTHVLLAAALLLWLLGLNQARGPRLTRTLLDLPILLWIAVLAFSTLFSISLNNSLYGEYERYGGLLTQVSYAVIFIMVVNLIRSEGQVKTVNLTIAVTALILSFYAIVQHYGLDFIDWSKISHEPVPVVSTLGNSNFLADYLVLTLPLIMALYFTLPHRRLYLLFTFAMGYAALLFSYCRAGWIGFTVAGLIFFTPTARSLWQKQRQVLLTLICLIIIITLFVNFLGAVGSPQTPLLIKRLTSSIDVGEGTAAQRLSIWESSLTVFKVRPLTGWGLETFGLVFPYFQKPDYHRIAGNTKTTDKTHNEFLQIAVSSGLLSLLLFLWLLVLFTLKMWETATGLPESDTKRFLLLGYLSGVCGYVAAIQFSFSITGVAFMFWLILGISLACQRTIVPNKTPFYHFSQLVLISLLVVPFLISCFSGLITGRNLRADINLRQGILAANAKLFDPAILSVQQATLMAPQRDFYRQILIDMYVTKYQATGNISWLEGAALEGLTAIATNPARPTGYLRLARIQLLEQLADKNRRLSSEIEKNLKTTIELDPYSAEAYLYLGNLYQLKGNKRLALRNYQKAHQLDKEIPAAQKVWNDKEKELGPILKPG